MTREELHRDRLTDRARRALELADGEAARLGACSVEPVHLLMALTQMETCVAGIVLRRMDLDFSRLVREAETDALASTCSGARLSEPSGSPALGELILRAFHCADARRTPWVGTEHLLLAALDASSQCAPLLARMGAELASCTVELERYLADKFGPPESGTESSPQLRR